jgi:hypothetical protein
MSPPHAHTSGIVSSLHPQDEDEDDICPICEGACTCNNKIASPIPAPLASSSRQTHVSIVPQALSSPSLRPHPTIAPPLRIKLTIPATLLSRNRLPTSEDLTVPSKKQNKNKSADAHSRTKRSARPPKTGGRTTVHPGTASNAKEKRAPKPTSQAKDTTEESPKRYMIVGNDDYTRSGADSAFSRRSHDTSAGNSRKAYPKCIPNQGFPTFVSADEFSSENESSAGSSSGSEVSELTDFSDSSIAEEEENFIRTSEEQRARVHDKARIKRELLGDGMTMRKEPRNNWEIRSRKKSVSPSDDEMDVDSDETDDEAEEGVEEAEGKDGEDGEEDGTGPARGSYVGIATGWSDDEESSFDADLFFAGLDSDSGPDISAVPGHEDKVATVSEDDDSIDLGSPPLAQGTFEITEGWDGSVIFTNGLQDGQGLLDWDFEANAAQLLIEASTMSESNSGSDIRMSESEGDMGDSEDEADGLEEVESNDRDTTEDELVDDRGLPTARAMRLFRPPVTPLFSINPLSTMSPGPRVRDVLASQSPRPSDILAGRDFGDEEDDAQEPPMSEIGSIILSASSDRATPRYPLMGMFEAPKTDSLRRAVIDESRDVVPSPFQRSRCRRPSKFVSVKGITGVRLGSRTFLTLPMLTLHRAATDLFPCLMRPLPHHPHPRDPQSSPTNQFLSLHLTYLLPSLFVWMMFSTHLSSILTQSMRLRRSDNSMIPSAIPKAV